MAREGEQIPVAWPGTSGPAAPPGEGGEHVGAVVAVLRQHCFSNNEPGLLPGSRAQPPAPPQDCPSQVQAPHPSLSPWDSWW